MELKPLFTLSLPGATWGYGTPKGKGVCGAVALCGRQATTSIVKRLPSLCVRPAPHAAGGDKLMFLNLTSRTGLCMFLIFMGRDEGAGSEP